VISPSSELGLKLVLKGALSAPDPPAGHRGPSPDRPPALAGSRLTHLPRGSTPFEGKGEGITVPVGSCGERKRCERAVGRETGAVDSSGGGSSTIMRVVCRDSCIRSLAGRLSHFHSKVVTSRLGATRGRPSRGPTGARDVPAARRRSPPRKAGASAASLAPQSTCCSSRSPPPFLKLSRSRARSIGPNPPHQVADILSRPSSFAVFRTGPMSTRAGRPQRPQPPPPSPRLNDFQLHYLNQVIPKYQSGPSFTAYDESLEAAYDWLCNFEDALKNDAYVLLGSGRRGGWRRVLLVHPAWRRR
jgi:hypothetical protein